MENENLQNEQMTAETTPPAPETSPKGNEQAGTEEAQSVVENKPEEKPVEDSKQAEEMAALKAEIERLKALESDKAGLEEKLNNLTAELTALKEVSDKANALETTLKDIVNSKVEAVPEEMRALIPENLSLQEKLNWINKANELGLFKTGTKQAPEIEIGKSLNPAGGNTNVDMSNASPSTLLSMAYSNSTPMQRNK